MTHRNPPRNPVLDLCLDPDHEYAFVYTNLFESNEGSLKDNRSILHYIVGIIVIVMNILYALIEVQNIIIVRITLIQVTLIKESLYYKTLNSQI